MDRIGVLKGQAELCFDLRWVVRLRSLCNLIIQTYSGLTLYFHIFFRRVQVNIVHRIKAGFILRMCMQHDPEACEQRVRHSNKLANFSEPIAGLIREELAIVCLELEAHLDAWDLIERVHDGDVEIACVMHNELDELFEVDHRAVDCAANANSTQHFYVFCHLG